ncbi:MAG: response regulator [Vibrio toranzoniae]|uniref:response regulator n=1 Tax=Vibrio toranzoniae TaxID=1194427 RepID=UPI003F988C32
MNLSPGLRVLIVDDSRSATILIKQQLVSLGISHGNIFIATNYQQAVKAVETHSFHVLLIDYHLEQSFTGFELLGILYRNRLIDHTVATILLSGDMRQETVLTALSGEAQHFITKPINTTALGKKVQTALLEAKQISQLINLYPINDQAALKSALKIPGKNTKGQFEATLIEHLITGKKWDLLSDLLNESKTNMHPTKLVAEALILDGVGKPKSAINKLHNYLVAQPLSLSVIDCLSCLYEKHQMLLPALKLALRSFELTPSVSHRAIRAIDLAENADNTQVLIKLGEIYASSISSADIDALNSISTYFNSLKATYERETNTNNKKTLIEHAGQFATQVNLKLPSNLQNQVLSNLAIFHCHILILENNEKLAHQKLVKAATLLSYRFYETPTDLLNRLLPLFAHFGEYSLYRVVIECIQLRGATVLHREQPKTLSPSMLVNLESLDSIKVIKDYIHSYPYSIAAKLDYLYAVNRTQIQEQLSNDFIQDITQLELPKRWKQWINEASRYGFSTKPPSPISTCNRQESLC